MVDTKIIILIIIVICVFYFFWLKKTTNTPQVKVSSELAKWINPKYLQPNTIKKLQTLAQENLKTNGHQYLVLDNFFLPDKAEYLAKLCHPFEEIQEDTPENRAKSPATFVEIPKERADELNTAHQESYYKQGIRVDTFQPEFFKMPIWMNYLASLVNAKVIPKSFKWQLRGYHHQAPGIFIHSDNEKSRSVLMLTYFNNDWKKSNGGLLQLWKRKPINKSLKLPVYDKFVTHTRCDMLNQNKIFRLGKKGPGGTIELDQVSDFHLADQIIPKYNRIFIGNTQTSPMWHAVTPNQGRPRFCLQQWLS